MYGPQIPSVSHVEAAESHLFWPESRPKRSIFGQKGGILAQKRPFRAVFRPKTVFFVEIRVNSVKFRVKIKS